MDLKSLIRTVPDWPKAGIMFRDVTTLFKDAQGFSDCIAKFSQRYKNAPIDLVVGVEARGFIVGAALANSLGKGFVPVRKRNKLPAATLQAKYDLEYGEDLIEIHRDAVRAGERVLIVDDLIATGGTILAAASLVQQLGGVIHECAFVVALPELGGLERLRAAGLGIHWQVEFAGE